MEQSKKTEGRESRKDNDLFFTCSLIEYIARKTKNKRADSSYGKNFICVSKSNHTSLPSIDFLF